MLAFLDIDWNALVSYVMDAIECGFKIVFFWLIDTILELAKPVIESTLSSFPSAPGAVSDTLSVFSYANYFLPISEVVVFFTSFLLFLAAYSAIKIIIKLIPTVG